MVVAVIAMFAVASPTEPTSKLDATLRQRVAGKPQHGKVKVIAKIQGGWNKGRAEQAARLGAYVYRDLSIIDSVAMSVPSKNLLKLAALPYVERVSFDGKVKKSDEFTVRSSLASTAWNVPFLLSGNGVNVAVVDSGVQDCDDLRTGSTKRVIKSVSFRDKNTNDVCGHGTHVAGIVAGNGFASTGPKFFRTFYGIAPKAGIVAVKVLDSTGSGSVSTVIEGISWVVQNKSAYRIKVMNLSLGHPVGESFKTDPLCRAVEAAWKSGIVVVCAAGNTGRLNTTQSDGRDNEGWGTAYGSIQSPGNDPYVITVGAMKNLNTLRSSDRVATYSSRGPTRLDMVLKPDIMAPGNRVISLEDKGAYLANRYVRTNEVLLSYYTYRNVPQPSPNYFYLSGTSMAAPVVSGAAALMLQANPNLSPDTVKARLMMTATKWLNPSGLADPFTYGAGYVDIPSALTSTVVATQSALSPYLVKDAYGNVYIKIDEIWGSKALWGTNLTNLRAVWGAKAIWGSSQSYVDGSRAAWGSSVWADRAVWGASTGCADLSSVAISGE